MPMQIHHCAKLSDRREDALQEPERGDDDDREERDAVPTQLRGTGDGGSV